MILDHHQIEKIILTNPNKATIKKGVDYNKTLRMHLYGIDLKDQMKKIDGFETNDQANLKVLYARSNKDLFVRLKKPIDKVFSARGGSVYYNLDDENTAKARALIMNVRQGYSIRKWVETFWMPHLLDDPYGITFLEMLPKNEAITAHRQGRSFVYPTYKSITSIYDYLPTGSALEYIVFKVENQEKMLWGIEADRQVYRVVDDAYDYLVERTSNDEVKILENHTMQNFFGVVPAQINSDIVSPENENHFLSFFDDVIELAQHFLMKGAIKLTHEFLHAYPKYWQYAEGCGHCGGTGNDMNATDGKCGDCKGTGKKMTLRVSDAMLLDPPTSKEDPLIAPNIAGYVSPDKTYYDIATSDMKTLEELMHTTTWGSQPKSSVQGMQVGQDGYSKTATQVMDEGKPQADRLQVVSEMAEKRHKFILDNVVKLNLRIFNYGGSSVNYGRRYMIEGPDDIWKKYSDARTAGAPVSVLEDLLIEYYEAKYTSDPIALSMALKLMYVEPFVHHTVDEVKAFGVSEDRWKAKLYFSEWLKGQNENVILISTVAELEKSLTSFSAAEKVIEPQKQLAA